MTAVSDLSIDDLLTAMTVLGIIIEERQDGWESLRPAALKLNALWAERKQFVPGVTAELRSLQVSAE